MRIARTTGVSDTIVKVRRGISLRPVREEPKKPEKIPFNIAPNLAKAIANVGTSMGEARNAIDSFAMAAASAGSWTVLDFSIPYEVLEDMQGIPHMARSSYAQLGVLFWRGIASRCGHRVTDDFTHVEVYQEHSNLTFRVRLSNQGNR